MKRAWLIDETCARAGDAKKKTSAAMPARQGKLTSGGRTSRLFDSSPFRDAQIGREVGDVAEHRQHRRALGLDLEARQRANGLRDALAEEAHVHSEKGADEDTERGLVRDDEDAPRNVLAADALDDG